MKIPFVCKSESFVSLSLWKLIHVIPNFDIMRCDFQRCTTSSCYIANQFSYQDKRKKILIRRSLFFFFFFSGLLKCIRMKDNEGNINSKILILLLFFSFEDVYRARVEFVHDCIGSIQDCICFERKKKQTNGCHRAFTHIEQWVLSRRSFQYSKPLFHDGIISSFFLEKCLPLRKMRA